MVDNNAKERLGALDLSLKDLETGLKSPIQTGSNAELETKKWLFDRRLEYGRYFFDHHAKQRMTMFNYFLVFVGLIVSGYASILKVNPGFAGAIACIGAIFSVFFVFLERRNEELVHIAEDVLEALERDVLFAGYDRLIRWPKRRRWWGMMNPAIGTAVYRPLGIFRRQTADARGTIHTQIFESGVITNECHEWATSASEKSSCKSSKYEHGIWMPWFQYLIVLLFLGLSAFAWKPSIIIFFHWLRSAH